ncbi:LysE family translocator [Leuconostoc suionicum]|uniref:LysE family translocator n=1 Tax=Leuconostoc suionicum TaxID=1511761 RepID=UPI00233EB48E|nr:LysE family translocator [Leuconostoc suionicum]MDC2817405.1 LysE family translocator [Leuconostoc suionicum]
MTVNDWIAFIVASIIIIISPGPSVIFVTTNSMIYGFKKMIPLILGLTVGYFFAMVISLIVIGTLLKVSIYSMFVLKLIGSFYLVYLSIQMWTRQLTTLDKSKPTFFRGVFIAISNPKALLFYTTFFPQFGHDAQDMIYLALCYGFTSFVVDFLNMTISHFLGQKVNFKTIFLVNKLGTILLFLTVIKIWL